MSQIVLLRMFYTVIVCGLLATYVLLILPTAVTRTGFRFHFLRLRWYFYLIYYLNMILTWRGSKPDREAIENYFPLISEADLLPEAYWGPYQTSMMELFAKIKKTGNNTLQKAPYQMLFKISKYAADLSDISKKLFLTRHY